MHASDVLAGAADRSQPAPQGGAVVLKATIRHDTEENAKVSVCRSAHDFRSSLGSGHRHGRSACLKSANSRRADRLRPNDRMTQIGLKSQIRGSQSQELTTDLAIGMIHLLGGTETDGSILFSQTSRWETVRRPRRACASQRTSCVPLCVP